MPFRTLADKLCLFQEELDQMRATAESCVAISRAQDRKGSDPADRWRRQQAKLVYYALKGQRESIRLAWLAVMRELLVIHQEDTFDPEPEPLTDLYVVPAASDRGGSEADNEAGTLIARGYDSIREARTVAELLTDVISAEHLAVRVHCKERKDQD